MKADVIAVGRAPVWLACTGKERYSTPQLAAKIAKRRNHTKRLRYKARTRLLKSYKCSCCGYFHIGGVGKL